MCTCPIGKYAPPLQVTWTGEFHPFFHDTKFKATNSSSADVSWASYRARYYDGDGKPIRVTFDGETKDYAAGNGSTLSVKAKTTSDVNFGWGPDDIPAKKVAKVSAEIDGWCWAEESNVNELCVSLTEPKASDEQAAR
jgi:hypothetical protein